MTEHKDTQAILLDQLYPSPTNPRTAFDQDGLKVLADSIAEHGLLQALVVRPKPVTFFEGKGKTRDVGYEIVCGERRWRAAQLAGLQTVACHVRVLTDKEVLAIQLIENLQRADLDPIEEAVGFQRLLDAGYKVDDVAQPLGKSKAYVYGAVKLLQLPKDEALAAVRSGRLPRETAILIARIPSERLRIAAAKQILEPTGWHYREGQEKAGQPLSYRDAKALIDEHFMRELKGAPFDRKALDLVDGVGSCEACPKRTGNNPEEYPDARADVCTDPECFRAKERAAHAQAAAKLESKGAKVLSAAETKKIFAGEHLRFSAPYRELKDRCHVDKKGRILQELVGKELEGEIVVAIDAKGKAHRLARKERVDEVLTSKGITPEASLNGHGHQFDPKQARLDNLVADRFQELYLEQARIELETKGGTLTMFGGGAHAGLLLQIVRHGHRDFDFAVCKALCWEVERPCVRDAGKHCRDGREALLAILLQALADSFEYDWSHETPEVKVVGKSLGIDVARLAKQARDLVEADEKPNESAAVKNGAHPKKGKHKKAAAAKS